MDLKDGRIYQMRVQVYNLDDGEEESCEGNFEVLSSGSGLITLRSLDDGERLLVTPEDITETRPMRVNAVGTLYLPAYLPEVKRFLPVQHSLDLYRAACPECGRHQDLAARYNGFQYIYYMVDDEQCLLGLPQPCPECQHLLTRDLYGQ